LNGGRIATPVRATRARKAGVEAERTVQTQTVQPVGFVIARFVCFGLGRLRRPPVALDAADGPTFR
jgi:hypothetical protein